MPCSLPTSMLSDAWVASRLLQDGSRSLVIRGVPGSHVSASGVLSDQPSSSTRVKTITAMPPTNAPKWMRLLRGRRSERLCDRDGRRIPRSAGL